MRDFQLLGFREIFKKLCPAGDTINIVMLT